MNIFAKLVGFLRFIWFWVSFWSMTLILYIWMVFRHVYLRLTNGDTKRDAHKVACAWGQAVFTLNPGWTCQIHGRENLPNEDQGAVLIANHSSAMDICALMTTHIQFRWLSKTMVFKMPLMGGAMRWAGYVPIDRGNKSSHREAMTMSANWIKNNVSMLFFPEGTRSATGELKPFKSGAFRLAQDTNVPIVPIVIDGTNRLMNKGSLIPRPAHVNIHVLPATRKGEDETIDAFTNRVRDLILRQQEQNKK